MLTVRHIRHWYEPKLPHAVFINGFFTGMMRDLILWIVSWFVAMPPLYKIPMSSSRFGWCGWW